MADNVKVYKKMPGVTEAGIYSLEPTLHQESYFNSARLYEEEQWSDAIQGFEDALKEYYTAYDSCKIMCEEERENNKILSRSGLFGVHVDVLECRTRCPDQLRKVKGIYVKNYLARHYNYLQMAYFQGQSMIIILYEHVSELERILSLRVSFKELSSSTSLANQSACHTVQCISEF